MPASKVFEGERGTSRWRRPWLWRLAGGLIAAILLLYYPIGMLIVHEIDDDLSFAPATSAVPEGGSQAVAVAAALVDREVNQNRWVANDPFFLPSGALDNMPNFQQGIVDAVATFTIELRDQLGRVRGSGEVDKDLGEALSTLQYSGTKWVFDLSTSILPTATSEAQYRKGIKALRAYNANVAAGKAVYDKRADNLQAVISRIALDVGSLSAAIDRQIRDQSGNPFDFTCDDLFYRVKGTAYGYHMLLKGLRRDFGALVDERGLGPIWDEATASFGEVAGLSPWIVWNGALDGQLMPNHLAAQGFFLLRARTQLREITSILEK
ncbi:DUF2333 family protein [Zavarzinia compransoris]|uniref:DUF2333 family protein n=1 Tax=Zavarzinia marina TaxID=2911065 RepID=UPI001F19D00F|nr:DUF2333 family protein [Zavarzinia marina]MCF4165425.1 DUF2333 family protein [Zavarzinia marina]